jgi:hypothetical protein
MEKTEEMQDLFKRRVSEKAQKIILENELPVLQEVFNYIEYEYRKEDIENRIETSSEDKLTEKSVRKIAEILAYEGKEDSNLSYWDNIDLMIDKYGVSAKYELTDETMKIDGHILHRIRALRDFGDVEEGDLGGFIESEDNLSHEGDCWVGDNAVVYDNAKVYENAQVYGDALVEWNAQVAGEAKVFGNASISGDAKITGNAEISEGEISKGTIDGKEKKNIELD